MKKLNEIIPNLHATSTTALNTSGNQEKSFLLQTTAGESRSLILDSEQKQWLEWMDGKQSLKEIVFRNIQKNNTISFRKFFAFIHDLNQKKFFQQNIDLFQNNHIVASNNEEALPFPFIPLWQSSLIARASSPIRNTIFFLLFAVAIILLASIYWFQNLSSINLGGFLFQNLNYSKSILLFFIFSSALMLSRGILSAILQILSVGTLIDLKIVLRPMGLAIVPSDAFFKISKSQWITIAYSLSSAFIYPFFAAIFSTLWPNHSLAPTIHGIALLLFFIEIDPYKKSLTNSILEVFFKSEDAAHYRAYLKKQALFAGMNKGGFQDEQKLVVYSILAMSWTVAFSFCMLEIFTLNLPNLLLELNSDIAPILNKISAAFVLLLLVSICASVVFQLFTTIFNNLLFPFLIPYLQLIKKIKTKEVRMDSAAIIKQLQAVILFQRFQAETLKFLADNATLKEIPKGVRIIIQGDEGREMFVLLRGAVDIIRRADSGLENYICTLSENTVFGEVALFKECVRTADVVAKENSLVLIITKEIVDKLFAQKEFSNEKEKLLDQSSLGHFLSSSKLFKELPGESLSLISKMGGFLRFNLGDTIIKEDDTDDKSFYLVIRGELDVLKNNKPLSVLKQGDFVGEISLLSNQPRSATVTASAPCLLFRIQQNAFWDLIANHHSLALGLELTAEQRKNITSTGN